MSFSSAVKENLLVACHRRCCICHEYKGKKIQVHHIVQKADGGEDTEENGIPLCLECHEEVGSYNPRHPIGNKFTSSELRRHKEQWLAICKNRTYPLDKSTVVPDDIVHLGIRSFERGTENMSNETEDMLCLIDCFDNRAIRESHDWNDDIFNSLNNFIREIKPGNSYRLHLETHLSIAFIAGYLLDSKSGIEIYPMQKTRGKRDWSPIKDYSDDYADLKCNVTELSEESKNVALVLGITHNILKDVEEYIKNSEIEVSKIINCNVGDDISHDAIVDGTHAIELVNKISSIIGDGRDIREKRNKLHIFAACPVALIFYLGQLSRFFGKIVLYEFDSKDFVYLPSFELPINENDN
ncbi:MAG: HNH endonuclease [Methanobacterium sp.]|jgi:hypothetical protein